MWWLRVLYYIFIIMRHLIKENSIRENWNKSPKKLSDDFNIPEIMNRAAKTLKEKLRRSRHRKRKWYQRVEENHRPVW